MPQATRRKPSARIGTSGWTYDHWQGPFYPGQVPRRRWLEHYVQEFDTVELNATFYRLPAAETVRAWKDRTPGYFRFAVKGPRLVTHMKRLVDIDESVDRFLDRARLLGSRLGPILWQLPPQLRRDDARLGDFVERLPGDLVHVIEFRHTSWFDPTVATLLARLGIAFVIWHMESTQTPLTVTVRDIYVRLHGPGPKYGGGYSPQRLGAWARRIRRWLTRGHRVWVYFNNDAGAHAVADARRLKRLLSRSASRESGHRPEASTRHPRPDESPDLAPISRRGR